MQHDPRRAVILIADDNGFIRNLLRAVLQHDYELLLANDGAHAIQLSRERPEKIDILLSDVEMPGIDGPALARQIAEDRPATRIMFMSGRMKAPLDGNGVPYPFLAKPFDVPALRGCLRALLTAPASIPDAPAPESRRSPPQP